MYSKEIITKQRTKKEEINQSVVLVSNVVKTTTEMVECKSKYVFTKDADGIYDVCNTAK